MGRIDDVEQALVALAGKDENKEEEIKRRNADAVMKMYNIFTTGSGRLHSTYAKPETGRMLVQMDGHVMLLKLEQLTDFDSMSDSDQRNKNLYLLR